MGLHFETSGLSDSLGTSNPEKAGPEKQPSDSRRPNPDEQSCLAALVVPSICVKTPGPKPWWQDSITRSEASHDSLSTGCYTQSPKRISQMDPPERAPESTP